MCAVDTDIKYHRDKPVNVPGKSVIRSGLLLDKALSITNKNSTWEVNLHGGESPSQCDVINAKITINKGPKKPELK